MALPRNLFEIEFMQLGYIIFFWYFRDVGLFQYFVSYSVSNYLFLWVEMYKDVFLVSRMLGHVIWVKRDVEDAIWLGGVFGDAICMAGVFRDVIWVSEGKWRCYLAEWE